jgi:hypothetical protein
VSRQRCDFGTILFSRSTIKVTERMQVLFVWVRYKVYCIRSSNQTPFILSEAAHWGNMLHIEKTQNSLSPRTFILYGEKCFSNRVKNRHMLPRNTDHAIPKYILAYFIRKSYFCITVTSVHICTGYSCHIAHNCPAVCHIF